jgi:5-methyltetrahydropteroyltriglutamate--homocysteine methyltransferase
LIAAQRSYRFGRINRERLNDYYNRAVQTTIEQFEATGSKVITDGEQTKPSFLTYPIYELVDEYYTFSQDCFSLKFADGHQRVLPRLTKAPFRYAVYANTYIEVAQRFTQLPVK